MNGKQWWGVVAGVGMALTLAGTARSEIIVVPPRPGQVGLSVNYQYGSLLSSGSLGEDFAAGPGLAIRLRYRMRYERGLGLSFESHGYDVRPDAQFRDEFTDSLLASNDPFTPKKLTLQLFGMDFYQMFGTRTRTTRMVSVGAGLVRVSRELNDGETDFPGDGFYAGVGAGLERFFWQSWAWDLGGRYNAIFQDGKVNHDLQLSAGVIFYASL